jgi:PIN domain nuclease of toxin-antitoxin system
VTAAILDASAVIALIMEEPGARAVEAVVADSAMTTVNFAEAVGYFARNGAPEPEIREWLGALELEIVPLDTALAYATGLLLPITRRAGLSLGDRACIALARQRSVRAVTTDSAWSRIARAAGVEIEVIR